MTDVKISALTELTDPAAGDYLPIVDISEGADVNKTKRITVQNMGIPLDGWMSDTTTWTYFSATTFTIAGDVTAQFPVNTKIKLTQTTVKYFTVVSAAYSDPNTTVTVTGSGVYTLANAAITARYYSYQATPQGFPEWFDWSPEAANDMIMASGEGIWVKKTKAEVTSELGIDANTAKETNATHTGDVAGATELTIGADKVHDSMIDWGTGANQVSAVDVPIADAGVLITATEVEGALQENRTAIDLNTTHRGSDGSDHSLIDQDVTSGASSTLDGTNFTGIPATGLLNGAVTTEKIEGDAITDSKIDWGTAANQVSAIDVPIADTAGLTDKTEVESALQRLLYGMKRGWITEDKTWTYASATTFTVSGDYAAQFVPGTKIWMSNGPSYKYFYVVAAAYSDPNTTITITAGTTFTLADAEITLPRYSYQANPQGFPQWFTYLPVYTGMTSVTTTTARFSVTGRTCHLMFAMNGTGSTVEMKFTLPISAVITGTGTEGVLGLAMDNGAFKTGSCRMYVESATLLRMQTDNAAAAWTASGGRYIRGQIFYEI